jgi:hypothetical protein
VNDYPDPAEQAELSEEDLAVATLLGRYIERRYRGQTPAVHDLIAAAAEFGDRAATDLRNFIAFYDAMRAAEAR